MFATGLNRSTFECFPPVLLPVIFISIITDRQTSGSLSIQKYDGLTANAMIVLLMRHLAADSKVKRIRAAVVHFQNSGPQVYQDV